MEPVLYSVLIVGANRRVVTIEGSLCHDEEFLRTIAEAQIMIEKEIVELVWPYEVFCLLTDVAVGIGRYKLWAYWGVDDVEERCT